MDRAVGKGSKSPMPLTLGSKIVLNGWKKFGWGEKTSLDQIVQKQQKTAWRFHE